MCHRDNAIGLRYYLTVKMVKGKPLVSFKTLPGASPLLCPTPTLRQWSYSILISWYPCWVGHFLISERYFMCRKFNLYTCPDSKFTLSATLISFRSLKYSLGLVHLI